MVHEVTSLQDNNYFKYLNQTVMNSENWHNLIVYELILIYAWENNKAKNTQGTNARALTILS